MKTLEGKKIAVLVADQFQDEELAQPLAAMKEAGATALLVGLRAGDTYEGKHGRQTAKADLAASEAKAEDFDAVIIPGGGAPERLRLDEAVVRLVQEAAAQGKVIASICHGAQVIISAGLLQGRRATCWKGIRDDVKLAGARYSDEPLVVDGNLITSRQPSDIPQFNAAIIAALSE